MSTDAQKKLGERIRARRQELGLTQEDVAKRAGLTAIHVGRIEHGEPDVSLETLARLATALEMALGALIGEPVQLSEKAISFGRAFDQAPAELQAAILNFLSTLHRERGQS